MKFANKLIRGGQCTFVIDLGNTVNQWRRCTGPTNKFACYVPWTLVYFTLNSMKCGDIVTLGQLVILL